MFRHCVMFKWSDDASDDAIAAVRAGLDELAQMECVDTYVHGADVGVSEGNFDYAIVADFESIAAYRTYAGDADHLDFIATVVKPAISARAAVQYHFDR